MHLCDKCLGVLAEKRSETESHLLSVLERLASSSERATAVLERVVEDEIPKWIVMLSHSK
jgi:hypothetical protein